MVEAPKTMRVVSAVADKQKVLFYLEDGTTYMIKQGDPRLAKILDEIIPITTAGKVAVVSLENFNVYQEMEKKTNGFVKFFKMAKKAVDNLFHKDEDAIEITLPSEPVKAPINQTAPAAEAPIAARTNVVPLAPREAIVNQIKSKPEPVKETTGQAVARTGEQVSTDIRDDETIVAVIGDMAIPGVEALKPYLHNAILHNSTIAVENFLKRLVPMMDKRQHSVEDILRFLEKGDLPLADDGSIIAYKVLRKCNNHYVDCHTQKIPQRIGSFVHVDESLVDKNRRNECSNGLHIARRGYIGRFNGDVCVLCKIAPEDVITVPHNDPNKVRVCGYHILFELSSDAYSKLNRNIPMTDNPEAASMVARAIIGDHVARVEEVHITKQLGEGIEIISLVGSKKERKAISREDIKRGKAFDDATNQSIDPKALNRKVTEQIEKSEKTETRKLDVGNKPEIQKFINTYSGADFELASYAEDAVKKGISVHHAFSIHVNHGFRSFVKNFSPQVFDDQVYKIFTGAVMPIANHAKIAANNASEKAKESENLANEAKKTATTAKNTEAKPEKLTKAEEKRARKAAKNLAVARKTKPKATPKAEPKKAQEKAPAAPAAKKSSAATKPEPKKKSTTVSKPVQTKSEAPVTTTAEDGLTDVQKEVLRLYDLGKGTTEIAKLTNVPRGTLSGWIKKHRIAPGKPKQ